ncbi:hypothetical protein [Alistipes muris]|uniref:hypothetical protein n=1 Tax=Alistipes muris TaxID=2941326 RepID=UPI00203FDB11|nr:hypothetical protein [Alistipes muris]MCX4281790.1 hypothetical protein [Alistipes sp.]
MPLKNKRILFLSARTFGIPENITQTMEALGATVDFYDERPANSFIVKALIRINRNLIAGYINRYHKKIIEATKDKKYDYIFFIKGESFSRHNLDFLFRLHPEARTIMYYWDSIANNPNAVNLSGRFDRVFSFDRSDCEKMGFSFLPLFYFDEYKEVGTYPGPYDYDCLFVGTTHSDRFRFVTSITEQIKAFGGKCFTYFFFQGKIMFYKYKFQNREMRGISSKAVHFVPLSKKSLLDLYRRSRIVMDVQHPKQIGLTLRCLETLGAKRKLITTNQDIRNYDFYNPNNILVVDRNNPVVPNGFLNTPYTEVNKDIYDKYSITSWVKHILKESE